MDNKYGILYNDQIKLHRKYFNEMCKLIGIKSIYRAPRKDKHYTQYVEIESNYKEPIEIGCIFDEFPNQKTMKKLGWNSELGEGFSLISVPYDLPDTQVGALFFLPSAIDNSPDRLFRVSELTSIAMYPASITCKVVPEFINTYDESSNNFQHSSFTLLGEEDYQL
jgi:hypothetical protein